MANTGVNGAERCEGFQSEMDFGRFLSVLGFVYYKVGKKKGV